MGIQSMFTVAVNARILHNLALMMESDCKKFKASYRAIEATRAFTELQNKGLLQTRIVIRGHGSILLGIYVYCLSSNILTINFSTFLLSIKLLILSTVPEEPLLLYRIVGGVLEVVFSSIVIDR